MSLDEVTREWLAAKGVIEEFLEELPGYWSHRSLDDIDRLSSALLARLAAHKPPILLVMDQDEEDSDPMKPLDIRCDHKGGLEYWCQECKPSNPDPQDRR